MLEIRSRCNAMPVLRAVKYYILTELRAHTIIPNGAPECNLGGSNNYMHVDSLIIFLWEENKTMTMKSNTFLFITR